MNRGKIGNTASSIFSSKIDVIDFVMETSNSNVGQNEDLETFKIWRCVCRFMNSSRIYRV